MHRAHTFGVENRLDFAGGIAKERYVGTRGATKAQQACAAMVVMEPRRMQPMMLRRRTEVPDVRIAVTGQQRVTRQLVTRPFADHRTRDVTNVVLIEAQQRAKPGMCKRGACARKSVIVKPPNVAPLLAVNWRVAGRLPPSIRAVLRVHI